MQEPSVGKLVQKHKYKILAFLVIVFITAAISHYFIQSSLSKPPSKESQERSYTEHSSTYSAESTKGWVFGEDKSAKKEDSSKTDTAEENKSTNRKHSVNIVYSDPDLASQEGMWRAANALVVLTLVQMFISSLALLLLGWTLFTQKGELDEARKMSKSQRAFMVLDASDVQPINAHKDVMISVQFRNAGYSAAVDTAIRFGHAVVGDNQETPTVDIDMGEELFGVNYGSGQTQTIGHPIPGEGDFYKSGPKEIVLGCLVLYTDVFEVTQEDYIALRFKHVGQTGDGRPIIGGVPVNPKFTFNGEPTYDAWLEKQKGATQ